jgi:DNA-directed RNA polymerase, mitochondrial
MRTPPRPWRSLFGGGPIDGRLLQHVGVLRTHAKPVKAAVKAAAADGTMELALDAVNSLQATPWCINKRILGAIEACLAAGVEVKGLPKHKRSWKARLKELFPGLPAKDGFKTLSKAEQGVFLSERARIRAYNSGVISESVALKIALKTAHMFEDAERFHTPMNMDFQGRVHSICSFHFQRETVSEVCFFFRTASRSATTACSG